MAFDLDDDELRATRKLKNLDRKIKVSEHDDIAEEQGETTKSKEVNE